ncbi:MAG: nucleoside-diphosphate sugar epimerase/dehydratase [Marinomonas foliarum]|uniref:nucleoside-diphosphate sugar epimerase/dehydratase n=1 Tax=Marinomonas foliarum TaxID=491950 RepID=UPI003F958DF1
MIINALTNQLLRCFQHRPVPKKLIFIGIDYLCFALSKSLLDNNKTSKQPLSIIAFIDDEPWNNRTLVHGVTVFSPSEVSALIRKHDVEIVIQVEGESIKIADNIWDDIVKTKVSIITLKKDQNLQKMQDIVYQACEESLKK